MDPTCMCWKHLILSNYFKFKIWRTEKIFSARNSSTNHNLVRSNYIICDLKKRHKKQSITSGLNIILQESKAILSQVSYQLCMSLTENLIEALSSCMQIPKQTLTQKPSFINHKPVLQKMQASNSNLNALFIPDLLKDFPILFTFDHTEEYPVFW